MHADLLRVQQLRQLLKHHREDVVRRLGALKRLVEEGERKKPTIKRESRASQCQGNCVNTVTKRRFPEAGGQKDKARAFAAGDRIMI